MLVNGAPSATALSGVVLETALWWEDHLLLFLTDDIPFEEGLHIYLLDERLQIVDQVHMVGAYTTGVFTAVDLTKEDTVRFRFFGGIVWTLTLLEQDEFAWPFFSDPRGVWRPLKWTRRFRIDGKPLPETR